MARTVPARAADIPDWQRNRKVARLTKEILALERDTGAKVVAAVVEMATKMRQIQAVLEQLEGAFGE